MILELYSVRDTKGAYSQPVVCPNEAFALRMFIGSVRSDKPNAANIFPEDKEFWLLGYMDDQTGKIESKLKCIAYASSYILPREPEKKEAQNDGSNANG